MTTAEARQEIVDALTANRTEAEDILNSLPEYDDTMIVLCGDLPIQFTVNGRHYSNATPASLSTATRFNDVSPAAVDRVAGVVRNGNGTRGHAVPMRLACEQCIDRINELLASIEEN